jgi:hypothetical protein
MDAFLEEYALMGAIGLPIVLVAAANIYLAVTNERGAMARSSRTRAAAPEPVPEGGEAAAGPGASTGA